MSRNSLILTTGLIACALFAGVVAVDKSMGGGKPKLEQNELTWLLEQKCAVRQESVFITEKRGIFRKGGWTLNYPIEYMLEYAEDNKEAMHKASRFEHAGSQEDVDFFGSPEAIACLYGEMRQRGYVRDERENAQRIIGGYHELKKSSNIERK